MTQLLTHLRRYMLRRIGTAQLRNIAPDVMKKPTREQDALVTVFKAADSTTDLLQSVLQHLPGLDQQHLLVALRALFELHRNDRSKADTTPIVCDPAFEKLCSKISNQARSFEINELIESLKILTYLQIPLDSSVMQTMMQLIRYNINSLNIRQTMLLDFLLSKHDSENHLVDALKLALPLVFQIHMPLEIDHQDMSLLKDMLSYACSHELPDRCIDNIVTGLLLHDQKFTANVASNIIWSLCEINCTEEVYPTRVQLLHICFDILSQNLDKLSLDNILALTAKVKNRVVEMHPEFYHEPYLDAVADHIVKNDVAFEKSLTFARVFSRMAHTCLNLIEHICVKAASEPSSLSNARTQVLFSFVNCLANNNYMPDPSTWSKLKKEIGLNPILAAETVALPWAKFALELASLGYYEDVLLSKLFSKQFLDEYLARHNNYLDHLQLLTLNEAVKQFHGGKYSLPPDIIEYASSLYPIHESTDILEKYVVKGVGGTEFVAKNVVLPNGIVSDLLVSIHAGCPVPLNKDTKLKDRVKYEELKLPDGAISICILNFHQGCFSLNSNRLRGTFRLILDILEARGFVPVAVNLTQFLNNPSHERTPYLMRELSYKCNEVGVRLNRL